MGIVNLKGFENLDLDKGIAVKENKDGLTELQMEDESGFGTITILPVFPGVYLMFNNFHMRFCNSEFQSGCEILSIDYCREGRIEWEKDATCCVYLQAGDVQINHRQYHRQHFEFPLSHYHGITLSFAPSVAAESFEKEIPGLGLNIEKIFEGFKAAENPYILQKPQNLVRLFEDLYTMPKPIESALVKCKVAEILLHVSIADSSNKATAGLYYSRHNVETTKSIMALMVSNLEEHYTLEMLSTRFSIPLTTMKQCFKGVYGLSIYAFLKQYRMCAAAHMLKSSTMSVSAIASKVGYDNASKFAAAFRTVLGVSPIEYRKSPVQTELYLPFRSGKADNKRV